MSSSNGGIGSTHTGGIQDIAAILPLLGTGQCSVQVSSALTRGYLYAASAPMSIIGSLGVVNVGCKTLAACFSFRNIEGARILGNMGFQPQGENLSLIMVEGGKEKNLGRYIIEDRLDLTIDEFNIDGNRRYLSSRLLGMQRSGMTLVSTLEDLRLTVIFYMT
jgi:hypothetical protein